jgi:hypothetical protein
LSRSSKNTSGFKHEPTNIALALKFFPHIGIFHVALQQAAR